MKTRRIRRVTALGAATVAFSLVGCPAEPDDGILPDRDTIPEPRLEREPYPAAEPYGDVEPAPAPPATVPAPPADEEGTFERNGERLDEAAEETGQELRQGAEEAGDAAGRAGEWVEQETDQLPRRDE